MEYKTVSSEFVKFYYHAKDNQLDKLKTVCNSDCKFTYNEHEMCGVDTYIKFLKGEKIKKMLHLIKTATPQPHENGIIIVVSGIMKLNNDFLNSHSFIETIYLKKEYSNYVVTNSILNTTLIF